MTELEILQHAKDYLDKLAKGIDPLTGREVPEGEIINNVRISRCLFYVSDVLRQVIENGGIQVKAVKDSEKAPFALSFEDRSRYAFGDWPLSASQIAQRLNELVDLETMQKLKTTSITKFLLQSGLLFDEEGSGGKKNKRPTEAGRELGISTQLRTGQNGDYTAVVYSREAQQFILDNQAAFNYGAREEFGLRDDHFEDDGEIISRATIEQSIDGGEAYRIVQDGQQVGGVVIKVEGERGDLELLFVSPRVHSKGIGYAAWCAVEKLHP